MAGRLAALSLIVHCDGAVRRDRGYRVCLMGKVRSGCRGPLCERDVVSEAFELFDEPLGLPLRIALREVVGAEVAVGLAGGEHVPDRGEE